MLTDFANIKLAQNRYELANPVQFYLIRGSIKSDGKFFSDIFGTTLCSSARCFIWGSEKLKYPPDLFLVVVRLASNIFLRKNTMSRNWFKL